MSRHICRLEFIVRKKASKVAVIGAGLAAGSLALTPALSAVRSAFDSAKAAASSTVSLKILGSIGSFTPVTRDERLARAYAVAARDSQSRSFRFTPTSGSTSGERSLTVLVRATPETSGTKRMLPDLGVAPVGYKLGGNKGLDRLAGEVSVPVRDLSPVAGKVEMPSANFVLPGKRDRFSTNLQVDARTSVPPASAAPQTMGSEKTYSVDLSSSYSLTRNLNVQAGVRYRGPDNRLVPVTDQAKDSQAVYVGTTFKF